MKYSALSEAFDTCGRAPNIQDKRDNVTLNDTCAGT
jgi:hypothetical protein